MLNLKANQTFAQLLLLIHEKGHTFNEGDDTFNEGQCALVAARCLC
eukprot:COSAG01_NODE_2568_length_7442_cov_23.918970_10_plen_45_part_01